MRKLPTLRTAQRHVADALASYRAARRAVLSARGAPGSNDRPGIWAPDGRTPRERVIDDALCARYLLECARAELARVRAGEVWR